MATVTTTERVYCPLASTITVTPSAAARVINDDRDSGGAVIQVISSETSFSVSAGGSIQIDAIGGDVAYTMPWPTAEEAADLQAKRNTFGTVTANTTAGQTLKSGSGALKSFTVLAKGTSPTLQVYDNTTNSGTKLIPDLNGSSAVGDFPALNIGETYAWDEPLEFTNGCTIVIGGTGTTTVQFQVR